MKAFEEALAALPDDEGEDPLAGLPDEPELRDEPEGTLVLPLETPK